MEYKCEFCGKTGFKSLAALHGHRAVHFPKKERTYTCLECGLTFNNSAKYVAHLLNYHSEEQECPICKRRFKNPGAFVGHVKAHNRETLHCGYRMITNDEGNRVYEHVYVMERKLGRKLRANEIAHHQDKNILNNSEDNLELTTRSDHTKHHHRTGSYPLPPAKVTEEMFLEIRSRLENGESGLSIYKDYDIGYTTVGNIKQNKIKRFQHLVKEEFNGTVNQ